MTSTREASTPSGRNVLIAKTAKQSLDILDGEDNEEFKNHDWTGGVSWFDGVPDGGAYFNL